MVDMNPRRESDKTELLLSINSFDNPTQLTDVKAWAQLMTNLIFLEPGTYPSMPAMGVGIESYQYDFMDEAFPELNAAIINQQQTYLPDIPLEAVSLEPYDYGALRILLIHLTFSTNAGRASVAVAVNATPTSRNFLDFDISW